MADLVAFMQWMSEPHQGQRVRLGVFVLLFLAWIAVNRMTALGTQMAPEEQVSVYRALQGITINAAHVLRLEDITGSITPAPLPRIVPAAADSAPEDAAPKPKPATGDAGANLTLSQNRANAVRDFLASKGVEVTRLSTAGKGSSELANKDDPLAAENRRVKIVNMQ